MNAEIQRSLAWLRARGHSEALEAVGRYDIILHGVVLHTVPPLERALRAAGQVRDCVVRRG